MTTLSEEQSIEDVRVAPIEQGSAITGLIHGCAFMALCFTGGWAYMIGGWAWALPGALVVVWWMVNR